MTVYPYPLSLAVLLPYVPLITTSSTNDFSNQKGPNAAFENLTHLSIMVAGLPFTLGPQSVMSSHSIFITALCLSLAATVIAHEHHGDEIPEGEAISADPIVVLPALPKFDSHSNNGAGHYFMGPYRNSDSLLRPDLSHRHGSRGIFASLADLGSRRVNESSDSPFAMACSSANPRRSTRHCRILPRARPWWPPIRAQCPRCLCHHAHGDASDPGRLRHLSEAAFGKGNSCSPTSVYRTRARDPWKSHAGSELGTDALRGHYCSGLL